MDHEFWHARWQQNQIGFHQAQVTPALARQRGVLGTARGSRVLVPLCGKSLDMPWLAAQGWNVLGVELSLLAVQAFFAEQGLEPIVDRIGPFTRHRAGAIEVLCGDMLAVTPEHTGPIGALFDRAALVALPSAMRAPYLRTIAALLAKDARGLLVSFEYEPVTVSGPPFSIDEAQLRALYEPAFSLKRLERNDILDSEPRFRERGVTALFESAYEVRVK